MHTLMACLHQTEPEHRVLAASLLLQLGGTYSWSGESYTSAWVAKKAGLTSASHRNTIRSIDWLDSCMIALYALHGLEAS